MFEKKELEKTQNETINKKSLASYSIISKYRSFLMGISIVTVILFHFIEDYSSDIKDDLTIIELFYRYISSSSVDIFLILSGFGLFYSFKKNYNIKDFYKKHFLKIIIPYLLIAIPFFINKHFLSDAPNVKNFIKDIIFYSYWNAKSEMVTFWYIQCIAVCYLIFPFLYNLFNESKSVNNDILLVINFFIISLTLNTFIYITNEDLFSNVNIQTMRYFPFVVGVFLGKQSYNNRKIPVWYLIIIAFSYILVRAQKITGVNSFPLTHRYALGFFCTTICFAIMILMDLIEKLCKPIWKFLNTSFSFIGKYTLELYLSHVAVRNIMNSKNIKTSLIKNEVIMLSISILASFIVHIITNCFMKLIYKNKVLKS